MPVEVLWGEMIIANEERAKFVKVIEIFVFINALLLVLVMVGFVND